MVSRGILAERFDSINGSHLTRQFDPIFITFSKARPRIKVDIAAPSVILRNGSEARVSIIPQQ